MKLVTALAVATAFMLSGRDTLAQPKPIAPRLPGQLPTDSAVLGNAVDRASIVVAAAFYRRETMGDTAHVDYCSAVKLVGDSAALQRQLEAYPTDPLMRYPVSACNARVVYARTAAPSLAARSRFVSFDSISIHASEAKLFVSVSAPGQSHHETIRLASHNVHSWVSVSAELWGLLLY